MTTVSSTDSSQAAETWQEIESLIEELTQLSKATISARDFHAQLLDRSVRALASVAGAIWVADGQGNLQLQGQVNFGETGLTQTGKRQRSHGSLLGKSLKLDKPLAIAPRSSSTSGLNNPTDFLVVVCPIVIEGEALGVLELFQPPDVSPKAQRTCAEVAEVLAELGADFHRNRLFRELRDRDATWSRFDRFAAEVHGSLDPRATAYAIANEARPLLDCDRVSVVIRQSHKCRVRAVSGIDIIDRRAAAIRRLQAAAAAVIAADEPFHYTESDADTAENVNWRIRAYLTESNPHTLVVLPLKTPASRTRSGSKQKSLGALVVERFNSNFSQPISEQRLESVKRHSESALSNALTWRSMPLMWLPRLLAKIRGLFGLRRLPVTLLVLLLLAGGIASLCIVPADFNITARGELQPVEVRHVYAPSDAVVRDVLLDERQSGEVIRVTKGKTLIELKSAVIEAQLADVAGALATAQAEKDQLEKNIRFIGRTPNNEAEYEKWELQLSILPKQIESLRNQQQVLLEQQAELSLASPISGEVVTWNAAKELNGRAVLHGQRLLTVANTGGDWVVELLVPDSDIGHVLDAREEIGEKLDVTFILKSDPGVEYTGQVQEIARATKVDEAEGSAVLVKVSTKREDLPRIRPGTVVVAKIHCGRRSLGYVWLHDLIDAVKTKVLF